jgi:hypothetical protein
MSSRRRSSSISPKMHARRRLQRQHADDVVERALVDRQPRVVRRGELLAQERGFSVMSSAWIWLRGVITSSTLIASRSIRLASIVLCLPRKYWLPSRTSERSSSCVSVRRRGAGGSGTAQQALHEQVDEPHQRPQRAQQRREDVAHQRRERSAYAAPTTFGVISDTTRIRNVTTVPSARTYWLSPNSAR